MALVQIQKKEQVKKPSKLENFAKGLGMAEMGLNFGLKGNDLVREFAKKKPRITNDAMGGPVG